MAAVGKLEARQFVNELFLAKAQGIDAISRILEDAKNAESQNIAVLVQLKEKIDLSKLY